MRTYWITFTDGSSQGCQGQSEFDAQYIAEHFTGKEVQSVEVLPYSCGNLIWRFEHPVLKSEPDFCVTPRECAGKNSCSRAIACTE